MRQLIGATILACTFAAAVPASSQVKMTKEQILFYTSDWKGERFPDGRPTADFGSADPSQGGLLTTAGLDLDLDRLG